MATVVTVSTPLMRISMGLAIIVMEGAFVPWNGPYPTSTPSSFQEVAFQVTLLLEHLIRLAGGHRSRLFEAEVGVILTLIL